LLESGIDQEIETRLLTFEYKLTSMPGIGTAFASKLIVEIGDIRRLRNADKLARWTEYREQIVPNQLQEKQ